jgi:hypothetical protein
MNPTMKIRRSPLNIVIKRNLASRTTTHDKFLQMHDHLFEHQKALEDSHLLEFAEMC